MNFFFSIIIFLLTWIISALFAVAGVGAANTLIPIYYSLGIPFSIAAAAGLLLNVFSLSSATTNNAKRQRVLWKLGTIFLIPAVAMAPLGAYIGIHTPRKILLWIFVAFLAYTLYNLIRGKAKEESNKFAGVKGYSLGVIVGAIAGFLGGLLGVGGGMIILPVLALIETDYKKVSATAGYIALFSSASGFTSYLFLLRGISYVLWIIISIGGILGGFTGSYLMNKMKTVYVKDTIIIIIAFVMLKVLVSLI
ncbi:sulfite exporter TauE/SafE family protein [Acidianus manzaensis]|uniref:Probable membrane transporter protein n=1 Tax=Acidianus manzaensis TaxID=282676 RepID=A0A1W6JYH1_9CREN|nr:sulfite exporter TauE/SafE family protein [Acidianus manzaensis]ARM75313.1 permease [Acidianus manzaensis]